MKSCNACFLRHLIAFNCYTNNMKKIFSKKLKFATTISMYIYLYQNKVEAQEIGMSIYPPLTVIETNSLSSPTAPLYIQNLTDNELEVNIELIPFKSNNYNGEVIIDPSILENKAYVQVRDSIQILDNNLKTNSLTLKGYEKKELKLNVNISSQDIRGDYYYTIIFNNEAKINKQTNGSQISPGIASNLILTIGPKSEVMGGINEFSTTFYNSKGPVVFRLKVHNGSKNIIQPTGSIKIENIFGQKVGEMKVLPQYILTDSDRYLLNDGYKNQDIKHSTQSQELNPNLVWNEKLIFGWYKATANIQLAPNSKPIESSINFIAFPTYLFIPLTLILFFMLSIYLKVRRKI